MDRNAIKSETLRLLKHSFWTWHEMQMIGEANTEVTLSDGTLIEVHILAIKPKLYEWEKNGDTLDIVEDDVAGI